MIKAKPPSAAARRKFRRKKRSRPSADASSDEDGGGEAAVTAAKAVSGAHDDDAAGAGAGDSTVPQGGGSSSGGGGAPATKKRRTKGKKKKKKGGGSSLSFGHHDADDEDAAPAFKVEKTKASRRVDKVGVAAVAAVSAGGQSPASAPSRAHGRPKPGLYSKEMLDKLRSQQQTTVRVKTAAPVSEEELAKGAQDAGSNKAAAAALAARRQNGTLGDSDDSDQAGDSLAEEARHARLRKRNIATGDFVPLSSSRTAGSRRRRRGAGAGAGAGAGGLDPALGDDDEEMAAWEMDLIRRGGRGAEKAAEKAQGGALHGGRRGRDSGRGASGADRPQMVPLERLTSRLRATIQRFEEASTKHERDLERLEAEAKRVNEEGGADGKAVDEAQRKFQFFQDIRVYVSDLCSCLHAKAPLIKDLEAAVDAACTAATEHTFRRREVDVLDEVTEATSAGATVVATGGTLLDPSGVGADAKPASQRRDARIARRRPRPGSAADSDVLSDAEVSDSEVAERDAKLGELLNPRTIDFILSDVKEEFRTLHQVLLTFLKWRHCSPSTYSDTYCSLSLPQILAPFVRIQLLEWHPLLRASTFDQFPFFTQLFTFHEHESEDLAVIDVTATWKDHSATPQFQKAAGMADERIIPAIVELVAPPRLATMARTAWDPVSSKQTRELVGAFNYLRDFDVSEKALETILEAVLQRLEAVANRLCVPVVQLADGGVAPVTTRQFQLCTKFLANAMAWRQYLAPKALHAFVMRRVVSGMMLPTLSYLANGAAPGRGAVLGELLNALLPHLPSDYLTHDATSAPLVLLLQRVAGAELGQAATAAADALTRAGRTA